MPSFLAVLAEGKPNSLGRTNEVIAAVLADRRRLAELINCLAADDAHLRLRAGDALEKICRQHPEWVKAKLARLYTTMGRRDQPSLQWHFAQILATVPLAPREQQRARRWLWRTYQRSNDWIVLSDVLTALCQFAEHAPRMKPRLRQALRETQADPRPAVSRRATKLLAALG